MPRLYQCLSCGSTNVVALAQESYRLGRTSAARFLDVSLNHFKDHIEPHLRCFPDNNGRVYFRMADLIEYQHKGEVEPKDPRHPSNRNKIDPNFKDSKSKRRSQTFSSRAFPLEK